MNLRRTAGPDPWSITLEVNPGSGMMDLGSVNHPGRARTVGWSTSRQAYKLDRLNVMGYYKNRGHLTSHRLLQAVLVRAGPKKG